MIPRTSHLIKKVITGPNPTAGAFSKPVLKLHHPFALFLILSATAAGGTLTPVTCNVRIPLSVENTGDVVRMLQLSNGRVLLAAEKALLFLDSGNNEPRLIANGSWTWDHRDWVDSIHELPDGRVIMLMNGEVWLLGPQSDHLTPLHIVLRPIDLTYEIMDLPSGGVLINTGNSLFMLGRGATEAKGIKLPEPLGSIVLRGSQNGQTFVSNGHYLTVLTDGDSSLRPVLRFSNVAGNLSINVLQDGRLLVRTDEHSYIATTVGAESPKALAVDASAKAAVLQNGRVLFIDDYELSILDPSTDGVRLLLRGPHSDYDKVDFTELSDGRVLVTFGRNAYVLAAGAWELTKIETTTPYEWYHNVKELKDGRVLLWPFANEQPQLPMFLLEPGESTLTQIGTITQGTSGEGPKFIEMTNGRTVLIADQSISLLERGAKSLSAAAWPAPEPLPHLRPSWQMLHRISADRLLFFDSSGLYVLYPNETQIVRVDSNHFGAVTDAELVDGPRQALIGTSIGLFSLAKDGRQLVKLADGPGGVAEYRLAQLSNDRTLASTSEDTYLIRSGETQLTRISPGLELWRALELRDGRILLPTRDGLYVWLDSGRGPGSATKAGLKKGSGIVAVGEKMHGLLELRDGRFLIKEVSHDALNLLVNDDFRGASVQIDLPSAPALNQSTLIEVKVTGGTCTKGLEAWSPRLLLTGTEVPVNQVPLVPIVKDSDRLTFEYTFAKSGQYDFQLVLTNPTLPIGGSKRVFAGDWVDQLKRWGPLTSCLIVLFHGLVVTVLFAAARRSDRCFRILMDPLWSRAAVYFGFVLRHSQWAQLWLLDRYFANSRAKCGGVPADPYEPLPIAGPDGSVLLADAHVLNNLLRVRQIWLTGRPGMGKSALVNFLERSYLFPADGDSPANVYAAFKRWGYVLLVIPARRYANISVEAIKPEQWLVNVASRCLAHFGVDFRDDEYVKALISRGTVAIAIDGINEVGREEEVAAFALHFSTVPLFVTSQTEPHEPFVGWSLPNDIHEFVGSLLRAYLGQAAAEQLEELLRVESPELLNSLCSGYDVRLIIDAYQSDSRAPLPRTRMQLYQAILTELGPNYPREELGAISWKMWNAGERELPVEEVSRERLIRPLEREGSKLVTHVSADTLEFRHDLMRAYLAAEWLSKQTANSGSLLVHLTADSVWRVNARD